jgi:S1-C subfamily serine protease/cytochrome c-type biogenesis protein CcmH/NrfG
MSVRIRCPKCRQAFEVDETQSPGVVECPDCHQQLKWPPASKSAAPRAEPAPEAAPKPAPQTLAQAVAAAKAAPAAPAATAKRPSRLPTARSAKPARKMSGGLIAAIAGGAVVLLVLIGGGVYISFFAGGSTPATPPAKPVETPAQPPVKTADPAAKTPDLTPPKPAPVTPPPPPVNTAGMSPADLDAQALYERVKCAVVSVDVMSADYEKHGQGSGFLVSSDGLIVTNHHVMRAGRRGIVRFEDGKAYPVTAVLAQDEKKDLAVIKIGVTASPFLDLMPKDLPPKVGANVFAIGSPAGYQNTITPGIVSGLREQEKEGRSVVQHSAQILPGSSGGPLLDARARVIGVNTFGETSHVGLTSVGTIYFAVSSKEVHDIVAKAKAAELNIPSVAHGKPLDAESMADLTKTYDLVGKGKWLDAAGAAKALVAKNPENVDCLLLQALVAVRVNIPDDAIKAYEAAIKISPDEPESHVGLGMVYVKKGMWKEAAETLARAVKLKPEDASAQSALGEALIHLDRKDEALTALKEAVRLDDHDAEAWMALGEAYISQKAYPPAQDALQHSLQLNQNNPMAHAFLGMCAYQSGRYDEAISEANRSLQMQPGLPYAQCVLGMALAKTGHADQAKPILETLQKSDAELAKQLAEVLGAAPAPTPTPEKKGEPAKEKDKEKDQDKEKDKGKEKDKDKEKGKEPAKVPVPF